MPLMVVNVSSIHRLPGDLNDLQANHEEADTLTAFHLENTSGNRIILRASDTDVLIILIGVLGNQCPEVRYSKNVFMDCGSGNSRRYINVTSIVNVLEEQKPGLPKTLPGYAFTGYDFTSSSYSYNFCSVVK